MKVVDPNLRPEHIGRKDNRLPLLESGFELECSAGYPSSEFGLLYKFNNYLSLGITTGIYYEGAKWFIKDNLDSDALKRGTKFALHANYRFLDKMISPILSFDFGLQNRKISYGTYQVSKAEELKGIKPGISLGLGVSCRLRNNYLTLKFMPEYLIGRFKKTETFSYYSFYSGERTVKYRYPNLWVGISYIHTFNWKFSKLEGQGANWKLPIGD